MLLRLEDMLSLHLYDFGIFLDLTPDEEEKAFLKTIYKWL